MSKSPASKHLLSVAFATSLSTTVEQETENPEKQEKPEKEIKPHIVRDITPAKPIKLIPWRRFKPENQGTEISSRLCRDIKMGKCAHLPNGNMIFTDSQKELIEIYDSNGSQLKKIYLSRKPFDVAVLSNKLIAISFDEDRCVQIFDINTEMVEKSYEWESKCFGLSFYKSLLYIVLEGNGIAIFDHVTGQTVRTVRAKINQKTFLVVKNDDRMIYTNWIYNTVHCIDLKGNDIWVFKKSKLSRPLGITLNQNSDLLVAGNLSGNIYLISDDGKKYQEVIREKEVMDMDFDFKLSRLLTYKSDGSSFKYFVEPITK